MFKGWEAYRICLKFTTATNKLSELLCSYPKKKLTEELCSIHHEGNSDSALSV